MLAINVFLVSILFVACTAMSDESAKSRARTGEPAADNGKASPAKVIPISVPHEKWRSLLSKEEYAVLFEENTERCGSHPMNAEKREGTYVCAACYLPLFQADAKYESGSGWPSFMRPIDGHIGTRVDGSLGMTRTEYHCARCGGHQGHVFDDGPLPTGTRYCNNGIALKFIPAGEQLPALRGAE